MFRIKQTESGYIVEIQVIEWSCFGLKKSWKPYVCSAGTENVWYHKSYEMAVMNLKSQIIADL